MKSKKIIIITRDSESYKQSTPLKEQKDSSGVVEIHNSCLKAYEWAKEKAKDPDFKLYKWLDGKKIFSRVFWDYITINSNNKEWQNIPNELLKLKDHLDNDEEYKSSGCFYEKMSFEKEDVHYDVYFLYWNRTRKKVDNIGLLLPLVCKDCGIELAKECSEQEITDNMLYIHDTEWGVNGNFPLIIDKIQTPDVKTNHKIIQELIDRNFSFAVAFQHHNSRHAIYNQILNMEFGEKPHNVKLAEAEDNTENDTFIKLKEALKNI